MTALLGPGEVLRTARLRLIRATPEGVAALSPWLEAALAPEWPPGWLEERLDTTLLISLKCDPVGAVVWAADEPCPGAATIAVVAVEQSQRFGGIGGEAALALERELRRRLGVDRVLAPVPEGRGLALYFWLRLGYRPLLPSEAPWPLPFAGGGVWMSRDGE